MRNGRQVVRGEGVSGGEEEDSGGLRGEREVEGERGRE